MKKTLLALAAIAASSAVMAQSSVTLYGVADLSIENVKGAKSVNRVSSSNYNTSRFGLKGTEDIGGGLKGNFALESGVAFDTGANGGGTTRFFDRAAWVGLAGSFGDIRLGRIDTPLGDVAGIANGGGPQAYDPLKIVGARGGDSYRRADNTVTYIAPAVVPGLTTTLQYSTGTLTEAAGDNNGKQFGLSVKYAAGPLSAGLGYLNLKDNNAAANNQKANATIVYGGYDLGVAKAVVYYDAETAVGAAGAPTTKGKRMNVVGTTVTAPISPEFSLVVGAAKARNVDGEAGNDNANIVLVKGIYTLSKRTALYGQVANVNNSAKANKNLGIALADDKVARGIAVGVRHAF
jgi:GBP family porin